MADPTMKDVLAAITKIDTKIDKVEAKLEAKIDFVRTELIAKIATARVELRDELVAHIQAVGNGRTAEAVRVLEKDVEILKKDVTALKARPPARPTRRR